MKLPVPHTRTLKPLSIAWSLDFGVVQSLQSTQTGLFSLFLLRLTIKHLQKKSLLSIFPESFEKGTLVSQGKGTYNT
jgi:hypothetical protein